MAVSVSTCYNSHTCISNLLEKCFSFLLFILTHLSYLYNLSHRLTELNVSLFYLIKLIFFKNISRRQATKLNFIQQLCLQNFLTKPDMS